MDALRTILKGTASETGERFFFALVENLAQALGTHGAWVTEYLAESRSLRALAFWLGDGWVEKTYEHPVDGTPCEVVVAGKKLVHFPDRVIELYPRYERFRNVGASATWGSRSPISTAACSGTSPCSTRSRCPSARKAR
jgi:hypothetical protein